MNLPMFNMKAELTDTSLAQRFGVPPFSVLDAQQGYWQERKRAWLALGIKSELGRGMERRATLIPLPRHRPEC